MTLLDLASWQPDELLGAFELNTYPDAWFTSPFSLRPVVNIGENAVLVPEAQYLLGTFEAQRHLAAIDVFTSKDPQEGFKLFSSTFGHVLERYTTMLLETILGAGNVTREFSYANRDNRKVDSPDIFGHEDGSTFIVECKTARLPDDDAATSLAGLDKWVWHLTGGTERRSPLQQGSRFLQDWQQGHIPPDRLPAYSDDYIYLVVCYGDPPPTVNWPAFRRQFLIPHLSGPERALESRAVFLGIRELEKLAAVATSLTMEGKRLSLREMLRTYMAALKSSVRLTLRNTGDPPSFTGGFGDFCVERYYEVSPRDPPFVEAARSSLYDAAQDWLFGLPQNPDDLGAADRS
jgi:hypothetical protein